MQTPPPWLQQEEASLWRGREALTAPFLSVLPTGHVQLDQLLPSGGWPSAALIECINPQPGVADLQLFLPTLQRVQQHNRYCVLVNPPWLPYPPGLQQSALQIEQCLVLHTGSCAAMFWVLEQCLDSPTVGAVIGWARNLKGYNPRRLQRVASRSESLAFFCSPRPIRNTPAVLRLQLHHQAAALEVEVVKCRGILGTRKAQISFGTTQSSAHLHDAQHAPN